MSRRTGGRREERTRFPGVYKHDDGSYSGRYRDAEGRQCRVFAASAEDANLAKAEGQRRAALGRTIRRPTPEASVWQYADAVLSNYRGVTGHAREATVTEYRSILRRHLTGSELGRRRIATVRPTHVRKFFAGVRHSKPVRMTRADGSEVSRRTGTYSNATMRHLMAAMRAVFEQAVTDDIFNENPCNSVRIGKPNSEPAKRTFANDVIKAVVAGFARAEARLAAELLSVAGMRISELSGLNVGDVIPIANGSWGIHIERRVRGSSIGRTKSDDGVRPVPIPSDLAERLREHISQAPSRDQEAPLFRGTRGGRMNPAVFRAEFDRAKEVAACAERSESTAAMIRAVTPHGFRHSAARRWRLAGFSMEEISRMLGHADITTTIKFYGAVLDEDLPDGDRLAF